MHNNTWGEAGNDERARKGKGQGVTNGLSPDINWMHKHRRHGNKV